MLLSAKDKGLYVGFTENLKKRFAEHSKGKVKSTSSCRPLKLVYYEACLNIDDAIKREKYFKMIPQDRIELNPRVCNGKPVIKGTRIPVSVVLEQIAQGESWDELLQGYPELNKEDIKAALLYASASIEHTEVRAANA